MPLYLEYTPMNLLMILDASKILVYILRLCEGSPLGKQCIQGNLGSC
jgi:hypothetical protein